MAELFDTTKQNISGHIQNIFKEGELEENSVVKESLTTAKDGKNYKTRFYNLDTIIAVGYRVKSIRGTQFRIWANKLIKEYLISGKGTVSHEKALEKAHEEYDKYMRSHLTQVEKDYLKMMGEDIKKLK
ncbi:MAG: virulence RhuM family protein [Clostridia bacterium]|nr:virulence RhuM family protein [Clostridia bacterium]